MTTPLLQLVHLSDIHFRQVPRAPAAVRERWSHRNAPERTSWFQGMEGHDPRSLGPLVRSIRYWVNETRDLFLHGTHLVVTGDLSTSGDLGSALGAEKLMAEIAEGVGLPEPLVVYGNHDVWPGSFPLFARPGQLDTHRSALRARPLHRDDRPARKRSAGQFSFWYLNTVRHGRFENTRAIGSLEADRYWEGGRQRELQIDLLKRAAGEKQELRIALTHHPVLPSSRWPWPFFHALRNGAEIEEEFAAPDPAGGPHRLVRVVMSGHAHALYPPLGAFDEVIQKRNAQGLHAQMVIGTSSQLRHSAEPAEIDRELKHQQCWQLLRFYGEPDGRLLLERIVLARSNNMGPEYRPLSTTEDPLDIAEHAYL